ncbi:MAG: nuclease [Kiritimatiellae bacterium]|nr:nuclease [Kiritimatiellia bacterium]
MQIIVDDRERQGGVLEHLRSMPDVEVVVRRLRVGDYDVGWGVVFERKTLQDFAASVVDGRLFRQAARLANGWAKPVCVLEGPPTAMSQRGLSREAFQGALIAVSVVFGIPVLRSADPAETARLLCFTARQVIRRSRGIVKRNTLRPTTRRRLQLYVLQGLPRVGVEKAQCLLERFGTVEDVMCAEEEELCEVHGIGPGTARAIRWVLGRDGTHSGDTGPIRPIGPMDSEAKGDTTQ